MNNMEKKEYIKPEMTVYQTVGVTSHQQLSHGV